MTPDTADRIITDWNDRLQHLADAIVHAAPQVTDIALNSVRVQAAGGILGGLVAVGFAIAGGVAMRWCYRHRNDDADDADLWIFVGAIFFGLIALIGSIIGATQLFDIWVWVSLFHPELWIAHKLLAL